MPIRDFIFPIFSATKQSDTAINLDNFLGSGFLIGNQRFGLTAAHVLVRDNEHLIVGGFVINDQWRGFELINISVQDGTDVAIFQINDETSPNKSPFVCSAEMHNSSQQYEQYGYPAKVAWEGEPNEDGRLLVNPDLVYFHGYIKRRFSRELLLGGHQVVAGTEFFEISEHAGKGSSGSPLFVNKQGVWQLIGIYAAEKNEISHHSGDFLCVSYATRVDAFRNWSPAILAGRKIAEECSAGANFDIP